MKFFHGIIFPTSGIKIYISHELISHKSQLWNLFYYYYYYYYFSFAHFCI